MQSSPADRNKEPILNVLKEYIKNGTKTNLLEISSGIGVHITHFAPNFPDTSFQPSEFNKDSFTRISNNINNCASTNIYEPIFVDASTDFNTWGKTEIKLDNNGTKDFKDCVGFFDYILNINMIHITDYSTTTGLFRNASKLLKTNGLLFLYGPFSTNGIISPESNIQFNNYLRFQDESWGLRDTCDLEKLAQDHQMKLLKTIPMPSNNLCLIWQKS
ncbi:unnamed protein product [Diamesa serratosioi]